MYYRFLNARIKNSEWLPHEEMINVWEDVFSLISILHNVYMYQNIIKVYSTDLYNFYDFENWLKVNLI
jgi:hypothetical protein